MSFSSNFPTIAPSLNLDFANTKALDPRVTFTRASTATFYDGLTVAKAEENLLTYSQEFENAAWTKNRSSVSQNSIAAPDGTTTADTIVEDNTNGQHFVTQAVTVIAATYIVSAFFQAKERSVGILSVGSFRANFDLTTVSVTQTTGSPTATSIVSAGGGWYRCTMTVALSAGSAGFQFGMSSAPTGFGYLGDGTSGIYVWGAQLEQRSAVTAYTATTTQAITNYIPVLITAAAGVARFNHNPVTGESLGLLIEEQRANLLTYSEQFDNAAWSKTNSSITANTIVAPDGTLTGDLFVPTATSGVHAISQVQTVSAAAHTQSVYAKAGGYSWLTISMDGSNFVYYDLVNGALGTVGANHTATITPVGNGWYRCTATQTFTAGSRTVYFNVASANNTVSYTGDGTSGLYIWGAQLEAGAFATSYISTVASSVTRAADAASVTGNNFSSWYRADEGTLFAEWSQAQTASTTRAFQVDDGSSNNRIYVGASSIGATTVVANNSTQAALGVGAVSANIFTKVIGCYKVNDFAMSTNASSVSTDTSGIIPTVDRARIGVSETAFYVNGTIKKIAYYPLRLTNAQLQALTS